MRACGMMLVGLALGCGASAPPTPPAGTVHVLENTSMTATETAPEPKAAPSKGGTPWHDPRLDAPKLDETKYPERITVRVWVEVQKMLSDPRTVNARRETAADGTVSFFIPTLITAGNTMPVEGSEITDSSGVVWVTKKHYDLTNSKGEHKYIVTKR